MCLSCERHNKLMLMRGRWAKKGGEGLHCINSEY
jgi:hypothetical protein